jgi:ABC-2 type transport system permease protein
VAAALHLDALGMLMRRSLNEILRVPGAAIPGILAPSLFMLGLTAAFGELTDLPGFTTASYISFLIPVSILQGASFTGAATGVNTARDIELGWFDRLYVAPLPRWALLAGIVLSASFRALLPMTGVLVLGLSLGAHWPGIPGLLLAVVFAVWFGAVAASWTVGLALKFRTQDAAPLMQSSMFMAVLFTTSYAPMALLTGWLQTVAAWNPVTQVIEGIRQVFLGDVTWTATWHAIVVLAVLLALAFAFALRQLKRTGM